MARVEDLYKYKYMVAFKSDYIEKYEDVYYYLYHTILNKDLLWEIFYGSVSNYLVRNYDIKPVGVVDMVKEVRVATNEEYTEEEVADAVLDAIETVIFGEIEKQINGLKSTYNTFKRNTNTNSVEVFHW